jgi:hypothetical protein
MASATGIPQTNPDPETGAAPRTNDETEPLLGRPGDVSQKEDASIFKNFVLGKWSKVQNLSSEPKASLLQTCFPN